MGLVTIDVMALLANIFIKLIACEMKQADEEWVNMVSEYLESTGLFCSSLFMIELVGCLFAFGFRSVFLVIEHVSQSPFVHVSHKGALLLRQLVKVHADGHLSLIVTGVLIHSIYVVKLPVDLLPHL